MDRMPVTTIGRFQIVREIARGGMATVYEAVDPALGRRVALKAIRESDASPMLIRRLHAEAAAATRLRHPNIVTVHDVGSVRDASGSPVHFIAMEYINGSTFADALPTLSRRERVIVLETVARAVAAAHAQGILHRDLKPRNVLLEPSSVPTPSGLSARVFLVDFGLAKILEADDLTRTGSILGTPHYMSPEQVRGETKGLGPATDIWSLGAMLYEVVTGRHAFPGADLPEVYSRIVSSDPESLGGDVPRDLEIIARKALEKEPMRRYASATEFADDLRRWLDGEAIAARSASTLHRIALKLRRNPRVTSAVIAGVIAVVIGGVLYGMQGARAHRAMIEEQARNLRRQEGLNRLAALAATIVERKRDLRLLQSPIEVARPALENAVLALDAHVREWPDDPQGYYVRGRGRFYLGDLQAAERDARAAVARSAEFAPGWTLLGVVLLERFHRKLYGQAETQDVRARVLRPMLEEALAALERGMAADGARWGLAPTREDEIAARLARVAQLSSATPPDVAGTRALLDDGMAQFKSEEYANWMGALLADTPAEKIHWQTRAIELAPGYAKAHLDRGNAKFEAKDRAGAMADYRRAIELDPGMAMAWFNCGVLRQESGDVAGAIEEFDQAIAVDPDLDAAWYNRGAAKRAKGDPAGAILDFDRVLALGNTYYTVYYARANARRDGGDAEGAIADYGRSIEARPDFASAFINRGNVYLTLKDLPAALADMDAAIALTPDDPVARFNRGKIRVSAANYEGAVADFEAALRLAPRDWSARGTALAELRSAQAAMRRQ